MAAGLRLDVDRFEAATLGDFWARLFVLEAADRASGRGRGRPDRPRRVSPSSEPRVRPRTNCFESTR